jgi:hypothetical protein
MNSKSLREQSSAGAIVFLMMALVFIPIIAVHAVMAWHEQLTTAPQQLAAIVNFALSAF